MKKRQYFLLIGDYERATLDAWMEALAPYDVDWHTFAGRSAVYTTGDLELAVEKVHCLGVPANGPYWSWLTPDGRLLSDQPGEYKSGDRIAPSSSLHAIRAVQREMGLTDEEIYESWEKMQ